MQWKLDKQLFTGMAIIVFLFNATLTTDLAWIWQGSETRLANELLQHTTSSPISWLLAQFSDYNPFNLVGLRLPGLMMALISIVGILLLLRKTIGENLSLLFFLVIMNNFLLQSIMKVASADIFSWGLQSIAVLSMIRFLKAPSTTWRLISYLGMGLAIWVQPLTATLLFIVLPTLYYFLGKQRKQLLRLNPWALVALVLVGLFFTDQLVSVSKHYYWGWGSSGLGEFSLVSVLGALPLLGFLLAALVASAKNLRKSEEFSVLFLTWFVVALFTQSLSILVVMSILIARHIQDFFHRKYPYGKYIQLLSTLHLVAFFFVAAMLMLGGFFIFRGTGFRSGLAFSFVYWVLSFILVIGIFGRNRRMVYAGAFLSGLLSTTLFCLQIFPLLENERIHRQLLGAIDEAPVQPAWISYSRQDVPETADNLLLYLKHRVAGKVYDEAPNEGPGLRVERVISTDSVRVSGWRDNFVKENYRLNNSD